MVWLVHWLTFVCKSMLCSYLYPVIYHVYKFFRHFESLFDLDPDDLWPWLSWPLTLTLMNFELQVWCQIHCNMLENCVFWQADLDLQPLTLTFTLDLDIINVHHHAKFGDHKSNGSWDMNFCPVSFCPVNFGPVTDRQTDGQTDRKWCIWAHRAYAQVCSKKTQKNTSLWKKQCVSGNLGPGRGNGAADKATDKVIVATPNTLLVRSLKYYLFPLSSTFWAHLC